MVLIELMQQQLNQLGTAAASLKKEKLPCKLEKKTTTKTTN